ncbi:M28 family peptidase [Flavobacterium terrigena]|uniref:Por secretion system C-terminal sorting domain-containing protein n=1 Tax=Flavobacterium terrigena TaxID=402734 RepID=A0A1H6WRR6_9FLAO|nr:M28 family peptidase [Flavobacterium terrigena]SEJ19699.1 Por secretion system C-terminal sorting domain-containing protein [Flavobacterium terrigena]
MKTYLKLSLRVSLLLFGQTIAFSQSYIQGYQDVVNQVSQTNTTTNLTDFENLGIKIRGSAAQTNTLNWLKNKYLSYGFTAGQMVEDPFTYTGSTAVCKNLIVTKTGTLYPNTYVIICAHYDTINGNGTNDNGSGTNILLETARLLQSIPTEYSIKFIHFSGEEAGLYGSQHYVSNVVNGTTPKLDIRLVFNIDQVGGVAGQTNNTITCERDMSNTPSTNNAASNTKTNELINCVELYTNLNTLLANAYSSDYVPFEDNNEVITGFYETNESNVTHTANDLLINMDPTYAYNVTKAAVGAMLHFAVANTSVMSNETFNSDNQVTVYPNPAKNNLFINKGTLDAKNYTVKIVDINGKTVSEKEFNNSQLTEQFPVSQLSSGIYMCVVSTESKQIFKKIIIE